MRWLNVVTSVDTISQTNNNVTVEFSNVTKLESKWTIEGMDLNIKNSFLPKTHFHLSNYKVGKRNFAIITMSTFGHLKVETGFKIQISDCTFEGGPWESNALIDITSSVINIATSSFQGFKTYTGPAVLNAFSSTVNLEECQFLENIGKYGVLQVSHKTQLTVFKTVFENNGRWYIAESTILVKSGSKAVVKNSQFVLNIASTGGCIRSFPKTYLDVQNSTFMSNVGAFGGAIYCEGKPNSILGEKIFTKDIQPHFNFIQSGEDPQCSIKKTTFIGNLALQTGGDAYFNSSTAQMTDCYFYLSGTFISGGVFFAYKSSIMIDRNRLNRTGTIFEGGAFRAEDNCNIIINNSLISYNTAIKGSTADIQNGVTLIMNNVTVKDGNKRYANSTPPFLSDGYSFFIGDRCSVTVMNSYFQPVYPFPWVFYMEDNSNLTVTGSKFKSMGNSSTQIVSAAKSSRVDFTKCIFHQCAGFVMSDSSSLFIKDSAVSGSQYVISNAIISASGNSRIYLDKSNITDIIPNADLPFVRSDSSNVSITSCLYMGNRLSRHIVATGASLISVSDSHFSNNTFSYGILYSSLFYLMGSQLSVEGTIFKNNHQYRNYGMYNVAIVDAYSSNVGIHSCSFTTAVFPHPLAPTFILHMRLASFTYDSSNYLHISNSAFKGKAGSLRIDNIANVNIQSSFFQIHTNNDFPLVAGSGLQLTGLQNLRIADSHFNSSKDAKTQIALRYQANDFQFLTSYSKFIFGNYSLESNEKNFLKKAQDFGLIVMPDEVREKHKETAYASGKYFSF